MNIVKREVREAQEKKLYTGMAFVKVLVANPTIEQLENILGYKNPKEPVYHSDKEGVDTMKLEIHVETDTKIRGKVTLWLERKKFVSKSGKIQFISGIGKTHWAETKEELDTWLKEESKVLKDNNDISKGYYTNAELSGTKWREAYVGEERLYEFIFKLLRADLSDKEQELKMKESIFTDKGIKELNTLFSSNKDCKIGVLFGVKGGYQNVYSNRYSTSFCEENTDFSKRDLVNVMEGVKAGQLELTNGLVFTEYNPLTNSLVNGDNKEDTTDMPF